MASPYDVTPVRSPSELARILDLQRKNLPKAISADEMRAQGFVTVEHDVAALERMHALAPSVIASHAGELVAYALTMPRECRSLMPVLVPMFDLLDTLDYQGRPLGEQRFYVMGQICIDKAHRGVGLFDQLYAGHRELYRERFDVLVTEVATRNTRSLRAHERVGFKPLHTYRDATDEWAIVAWDWSEPSA
ncbi:MULTISPECIES: GNAT family N-acetyltransferase [unclassified Myxococcus]|uniref:GNAT family N-acetyltransferase n=1 Tax=unclassified Myxococcus TaxID=2648731 RepID=UPI00157ACA47|nr:MULTISPECIES: GNAT family N-acetyltransferase [unclassified Myxococcus]NTX03805.1 GNAT family N-acetyltransferase [Myxococcus sp. CA040A]NTX14034.1 GNAT family N-acetyltransferase [Myxococcus sp. CA056]NTX50775.1 GNAT family N-acetyltransferase [Myxococcus sp. CA039A]